LTGAAFVATGVLTEIACAVTLLVATVVGVAPEIFCLRLSEEEALCEDEDADADALWVLATLAELPEAAVCAARDSAALAPVLPGVLFPFTLPG
jgi:hypothetical protein